MDSADPASRGGPEGGETFRIPALVSALVCVGLLRTGIFSFFFLVPLGFVACGYNGKTAWFAEAAAVLGNGLFALILLLILHRPLGEFFWDTAFFSLITALFTWIAVPSGEDRRGPGIPGVYRLLGGSVLGFLFFLLVMAAAGEGSGFYALFRSQAEILSSFYTAAPSSDAVQRSLSEQYLNPEAVLELFRFAALRGGGILSCAALFFISRQISRALARIFRRRESGGNILRFHVDPGIIWVFSASLLLILLARLVKLSAPEIVLWNIIVLCTMLYLAQGGGILFFLLGRSGAPPLLRLLLTGLFFILLLRPGINALILGLMVLLGIAENWVPFRAPKTDGPPSTPEA